MATWYWKKRRLNVGSQLAFHRQQEASPIAEASSNGWQGVADYIAIQGDGTADSVRAAVKSQTEAAKLVYDTINEHVARIGKPDDATAESKEKKSDAVVLERLEKLKALHRQMNVPSSDLVPLLRATEEFKLKQGVAEQAYRPDIMEKELKLHAEIDRRIEKAMILLARAKEHKKFYGARSVSANQIEATKLPAKSSHQSDGS
jgi:hypothetical protein